MSSDYAASCFRKVIGSEEALCRFEHVSLHRPAGLYHLIGGNLSHANLSPFQLIPSLHYAFSRATQRVLGNTLAIVALHDRVATQTRVTAYLRGAYRISSKEESSFGHRGELDIS